MKKEVDHNKNQRETVNMYLNELWTDFYDYPIGWSIDLAQVPNEIGDVHRKRLETFSKIVKESLYEKFPELKKDEGKTK